MLCARVRACVRAYLTPLKHGHKESSIFCPRYFTIFYLQFVICPQAPAPPPPGAPQPPPPPSPGDARRGEGGGGRHSISISIFCAVLCARVRACVHPLSTGTRRVINFTISIFCAVLCARVRACVHPLSTGTRRVINFTISIFNFLCCAVRFARTCVCAPLKHGHKMSYKYYNFNFQFSVLCCARAYVRVCVRT